MSAPKINDALLVAASEADARQYPEFPPRMVVTPGSRRRVRGRTGITRLYLTPEANRNLSSWDKLRKELTDVMDENHWTIVRLP